MDTRANCTVYALANATGIQYSHAHWILRKEGRKDNHGFYMREWLLKKTWAKDVYWNYSAWKERGGAYPCKDYITPKEMRARFPFGHYVVCVHGHALAYINGEFKDSRAPKVPRYRIISVIEINVQAFRHSYMDDGALAARSSRLADMTMYFEGRAERAYNSLQKQKTYYQMCLDDVKHVANGQISSRMESLYNDFCAQKEKEE